MKTLSMAIVFALSSPVWSNLLDGHWQGAGTLKMEGQAPRTESCSNVEIIFSSTSNSLIVESYKSNCPSAPSDWGSYAMPIKGQNVYSSDGETIIGTFDGFNLLTKENDGGVLYEFNAMINQNFNDLNPQEILSQYSVANLLGKITVEARLQKKDF